MRKQLKVVTIGGGSSYTPELIDGFIRRFKDLPVTDYYFLDIESGKEKLEIVGKMAQRMVERAGLDMKVHLTLDREEALRDADFVTTQLRVGGSQARIYDEKIPFAHGVLGQETTGPGGFMCALRTIPVLLDIARDMERLCPDAWMVNFTNPAGIVSEALHKYSNIKNIGICSGSNNMRKDIAKMYDVDFTDVSTEIFGLNHLIFARKIFVKHEDKTKEVFAVLAGEEVAGIKKENYVHGDFSPNFTRALGLYPLGGYAKYSFMDQESVAFYTEDSKVNGTRGEQTRSIEAELFEIYKDPELKEKPKQLSQRGGSLYSDTAVAIIAAIYNDAKEVHVANVANNGATPDLGMDSVVECNCLVDANGATPITYGPLPLAIKGLIQANKVYEELTVEAAMTGDYHTALLALANNPLVHSVAVAEAMLDEFLVVNKPYLPQFK